MNEILLNNQVIVYLLSESILFLMLTLAMAGNVTLLAKWNFGSFSEEQYHLERRAYLVMTILLFAFAVKFVLLLYFVFTIDSLAVLVPGAMCAAGVISANSYGMPLLFIKLLILFAVMLWMTINSYDLKAKDYPLFGAKSWLFVLIFALSAIEIWLDYTYFMHIDLLKPVSCCSTLYGQMEGANPLPFGLNTYTMLVLFYVLYFLDIAASMMKQNILALLANLLFVVIAYYSVVYFFGTYVYELPTHKCPFCMLQKEYYYVGYLIWGTLFTGVFLGLISAVMKLWLGVEMKKERRASMVLLSIFVLVCTAYVAVYYLRNGVFL